MSVVIIIVVGLVILSCSCSVALFYYQMYIKKRIPMFMPASFHFTKYPSTKYIGHTYRKIDNTTETDCVQQCVNSPFCGGATFKTNGQCSLQNQNGDTRPGFVSPWDGFTYYNRIDLSNLVKLKPGYKLDSDSVKTVPATSVDQCIAQCIGNSAECMSANYYSNTNKCDFLMDNTDFGTSTVVNPSATYIYRKGIVGNKCSQGLDCIYGLCNNNKCLISNALVTDEPCSMDTECISGKCIKSDFSYADQEAVRQSLLQNTDIVATNCDKYKTCGECEETIISSETATDKLYSAANCEWRYSIPISSSDQLKQCSERTVPDGSVMACFPKSVKKSKKVCQ